AVEDLDTTIRQIRSAIFGLEVARIAGGTLRTQVLAVGDEASRTLGFTPQVRFTGTVDTSVSAEISEHLLSTLREALSNVARHAHADSVEVELDVEDDDDVILRV